MQQEIHQQPATLRAVAANEEKPALALAKAMRDRDIRNIIIAARGTSDHAATYAKYLIEIENGIPVGLSAPSVHTLYKRTINYRDCLVLGISQSGQSTDVTEVVQSARASGALTASITNQPDSMLAKAADYHLALNAGEEKAVAATKTYTATLACITLLSESLKAAQDPAAPALRAAALIEESLRQDAHIEQLVERYRYMNDCVVLARGINQCTAAEAALKMIETCYVVAKPYSSADFLHGPFALVQPGFPVLMYAPAGAAFPVLLEVAQRLCDAGSELMVAAHSPQILKLSTTHIEAPSDVPESLSPLVYIVFAQLFACHLARTRGFDPDHPRGLTKVTQTR